MNRAALATAQSETAITSDDWRQKTETAKPSAYLPEIWGGEMADDEAFADRQELQDFLSLLMRTLE